MADTSFDTFKYNPSGLTPARVGQKATSGLTQPNPERAKARRVSLCARSFSFAHKRSARLSSSGASRILMLSFRACAKRFTRSLRFSLRAQALTRLSFRARSFSLS